MRSLLYCLGGSLGPVVRMPDGQVPSRHTAVPVQTGVPVLALGADTGGMPNELPLDEGAIESGRLSAAQAP